MPSSTARTAARATRSHGRCPTIGRIPAWRCSRCARPAAASTTRPPTAASMPSRMPAQNVARASRCAMRRANNSMWPTPSPKPWRACCAARSSLSRDWAVITSPAMRRMPPPWHACANARIARKNPSQSCWRMPLPWRLMPRYRTTRVRCLNRASGRWCCCRSVTAVMSHCQALPPACANSAPCCHARRSSTCFSTKRRAGRPAPTGSPYRSG